MNEQEKLIVMGRMTILQFAVEVYVPFRTQQRKDRQQQALSVHTKRSIYYAAACAMDFNVPIMSQLRAHHLARMIELFRGGGRTDKGLSYRNTLYAILRHAVDLGIVPEHDGVRASEGEGGEGRPDYCKEDGAPGTIWHYLQNEYFRLNVRIRSDHTKHQYRIAVNDLGEFLGRAPLMADLTDDNVAGMMKLLQDKGLAPRSINGRRDNLNALWAWAAKRHVLMTFPANYQHPEPKRIPSAWTREELERLFAACRRVKGMVGEIPAGEWWFALHCLLWDTGDRLTAIRSVKPEWINYETGYLRIPAEVRKGQEGDAVYKLSAATLAVLKGIAEPPRELLFPWPRNHAYIWQAYRAILRSAGLPCNRTCMFHKMRRSVASHVQAAGLDASFVLGHSSSSITRASYLDPTIVSPKAAVDVLFRPFDEITAGVILPAGESIDEREALAEVEPADLVAWL